MKRQKSVAFPKTSSNMITTIIKIIVKLKIIVIIQVNTGAAHSICNLKYT